MIRCLSLLSDTLCLQVTICAHLCWDCCVGFTARSFCIWVMLSSPSQVTEMLVLPQHRAGFRRAYPKLHATHIIPSSTSISRLTPPLIAHGLTPTRLDWQTAIDHSILRMGWWLFSQQPKPNSLSTQQAIRIMHFILICSLTPPQLYIIAEPFHACRFPIIVG